MWEGSGGSGGAGGGREESLPGVASSGFMTEDLSRGNQAFTLSLIFL